MANKITVQVLGGQPKTIDSVDTIQEAMDALSLTGNFTATINGEPATLDAELNDFEYVSLAPAVKGGRF
jgi:sulfur carrier protein ThiS